MFLLVAATELEMEPARQRLNNQPGIAYLVSGVGPLETAVNLTRYFEKNSGVIRLVINFGVGGAYPESDVGILDVCLASKEVLGDFGICFDSRFEFLSPDLAGSNMYPLENEYQEEVSQLLAEQQVKYQTGNFVTVNCVSGTEKRGMLLRDTYQAICENMEGAAVARVCEEFDVPMLELRCMSNLVKDRDKRNWKIQEASQKCGELVATVLTSFKVKR